MAEEQLYCRTKSVIHVDMLLLFNLFLCCSLPWCRPILDLFLSVEYDVRNETGEEDEEHLEKHDEEKKIMP